MVSVKLPKSEVSGFSSLESNEVAKFFQVKVERVAHFESRLLLVLSCPFAQVGQGSLLSGMSGVTAHDARYASLKRNERAQSTNGLLAPKGVHGRAPLQSRKGVLKSLSSGGLVLLPSGARGKGASFYSFAPNRGFGAEPQVHRKLSGHF